MAGVTHSSQLSTVGFTSATQTRPSTGQPCCRGGIAMGVVAMDWMGSRAPKGKAPWGATGNYDGATPVVNLVRAGLACAHLIPVKTAL
jgi:hypothetical protein